MKIRPLIINDAVKADIQRVKKFADEHRLDAAAVAVRKHFENSIEAVGENPGHRCIIPMGYRCVFSLEQHPENRAWYRHLSVSVTGDGYAPGEAAVALLAKEFGFTGQFTGKVTDKDWGIWEEKLNADSKKAAINVVQPIL